MPSDKDNGNQFKDVEFVRTDTHQITLPKDMPLKVAEEWIKRKMREEEQVVNVHYELPYSPLDGAVNFHRALAHIFGWTENIPSPGFWGAEPPTMIGVRVGLNETIQVPWGDVTVPGLEGFLHTDMATKPIPRFLIQGKVKQKCLPLVQQIVDKTTEFLKTQSIYKNKVVKVSYEWMRQRSSFNPTVHCPAFISIDGVREEDLIFSDKVINSLKQGLFIPIEHPEVMRRHGIPLKRGVLLAGGFGVGKTLTANITAKKAVRNGWTFIFLESALDLAEGLNFAAQYAPAVVFVEDVDQVFQGGRSVEMNELLNTQDGIHTKGVDVITVFTTNNLDKIEPALLRPGRIDLVMELQPPDEREVVRILRQYGDSLIDTQADLTEVGRMLKGTIPAHLKEVVLRAKITALARLREESGVDPRNVDGIITEQDLRDTAQGMQRHFELLMQRSREEKDSRRSQAEVLLRVPKGSNLNDLMASIAEANGEDE